MKVCQKCNGHKQKNYPAVTSEEYHAEDQHGQEYMFETDILHLAEVHGLVPPQEFIEAVMSGTLKIGDFAQAKSITKLYLTVDDDCLAEGDYPNGYLERLAILMDAANPYKGNPLSLSAH